MWNTPISDAIIKSELYKIVKVNKKNTFTSVVLTKNVLLFSEAFSKRIFHSERGAMMDITPISSG